MDFKDLCQLLQTDQRVALTDDSRDVIEGGVFVAIKGTAFDGHEHIGEAIERGAKYIVAEKCRPIESAEFIKVANSREAISLLAQIKCGEPGRKLKTLAVTGTNGKTTTCYLVRSIISSAGKKCGLIGTIAYDNCSEQGLVESDMTTPDPIRLAKLSREIVENEGEFLAIEASSHAMTQSSLAGFDIQAAAFTNLTGDHLDYHKTMKNYLRAKTLLFESLDENGVAVLNAEAKESQFIADATKAKIIWYGAAGKNEIAKIESLLDGKCESGRSEKLVAEIVSENSAGSVYELKFNEDKVTIETPMCGRHNISNQLAAAGLCLSMGLSLEQIKKGIEGACLVPGRLEKVEAGQDFTVLVDYAHTDDAIRNVLKTLRPICEGKLITVFGCGGDRDKSKRPRMARAAEEFSDFVIVTSDNPRTEEPSQIIEDILVGFSDQDNEKHAVEVDREKAIELAISSAQCGDIVLIAGKGHENYQVVGMEKTFFDDRIAALKFLNGHKLA